MHLNSVLQQELWIEHEGQWLHPDTPVDADAGASDVVVFPGLPSPDAKQAGAISDHGDDRHTARAKDRLGRMGMFLAPVFDVPTWSFRWSFASRNDGEAFPIDLGDGRVIYAVMGSHDTNQSGS